MYEKINKYYSYITFAFTDHIKIFPVQYYCITYVASRVIILFGKTYCVKKYTRAPQYQKLNILLVVNGAAYLFDCQNSTSKVILTIFPQMF